MNYPKQPGLVLTPSQAMSKYLDDLRLWLPDGRIVVNPALFATVYFAYGAQADVRQGLLACFDEFEKRFKEHLHGGYLGQSRFCKKTPKGIEAIRSAIISTPPYRAVEFMRSDVTDQYTAPNYALDAYTITEFPDGGDGGRLSYLKFILPWQMASDGDMAQYHDYLRFVCDTLPIRGGNGGLTSALPFDFDRYMPQEYAIAKRFTGIDIEPTPVYELETYRIQSIEGESPNMIYYDYLKPGARITGIGHIKGVNWYTILGDVFVDRLGGEAQLRAKLARPDITIERHGKCLTIQAGEFPRLGAPEEGLIEPYAFVNRTVRCLRDPAHGAMHTYMEFIERADDDNTLPWLARFDLPEDGPLIPWSPEQANPYQATNTPPPTEPPPSGLTAYPGDICPETGEWYAIHLGGKKTYIEAGQTMPGSTRNPAGNLVSWYLQRQG